MSIHAARHPGTESCQGLDCGHAAGGEPQAVLLAHSAGQGAFPHFWGCLQSNLTLTWLQKLGYCKCAWPAARPLWGASGVRYAGVVSDPGFSAQLDCSLWCLALVLASEVEVPKLPGLGRGALVTNCAIAGSVGTCRAASAQQQ